MEKNRLTVDDRINLQAALAKGLKMNSVCRLLNKNRSTIYREIKHYSVLHVGKRWCIDCKRFIDNRCEYEDKCLPDTTYKYYLEDDCHKLSTFPYVCNNCEEKNKCHKISFIMTVLKLRNCLYIIE